MEEEKKAAEETLKTEKDPGDVGETSAEVEKLTEAEAPAEAEASTETAPPAAESGAAGEETPADGRKKRPSAQKILAIALSVIAVLMVLVAAAAWGFFRYSSHLREGMFNDRVSREMQQIRQQSQPAPSETPNPESPDYLLQADWIDEEGNAYRYRHEVLTLLVMGVDYMKDRSHWTAAMHSNGGNTDVLALVILETGAKQMSVLYIPRDTMTNVLAVDAKGNYKETLFTNITTAHSYGDGGALSCELSAEAVSNLCYGIPIDRYIALDYDGIGTLNQALGGLELTLDQDYPSIDRSFKSGKTVRLNNRQLRALIQYRDKQELDGAYKRGLRDLTLVAMAVYRQAVELVKEDPGAVLGLYGQMEPYLTTNLSLDEVSYLAQAVMEIGFTEQTVVTMPGSTLKGEVFAEFYPDEDWLHDFIAAHVCEKLN